MLIHDRGIFDNADLEQMEKEILAVVKRYATLRLVRLKFAQISWTMADYCSA